MRKIYFLNLNRATEEYLRGRSLQQFLNEPFSRTPFKTGQQPFIIIVVIIIDPRHIE